MNKRRYIMIGAVLFSVILLGLIFNIWTFGSIEQHTKYTGGLVIKVIDEGDGWSSVYQYKAGNEIFQRRQSQRFNLNDTILVVYDSLHPKYSTIAQYPGPLNLDADLKIISIDTPLIRYDWGNYIPVD
jgi:hypothetical protein